MCLFKLPNFSTTIMVIYAWTPIFNVFRPLHNLGTVSICSAAIPGCADKSEFQAATWGSRFTVLIHTRTLGSWVWVQIPAPIAAGRGVFMQPAYREGPQHFFPGFNSSLAGWGSRTHSDTPPTASDGARRKGWRVHLCSWRGHENNQVHALSAGHGHLKTYKVLGIIMAVN